MGKALYREHRPLALSDVKGQSHITDTLEHAIKKGAISHAYLFTGPRGVGKTSVARILAHRINDIDYTDDSTHLDIIEIDAASNRRIDEIRDLRDKVHIAPTSSKYKVYIIDEVHMLTREAFNALLKTLEEPPEHAVFILATTEAHKVPDTIISRSQQFSFKPVTENEAVTHLRTIADKEKMSIDDSALKLLAVHGNGSFRDSISMLDQLTGFDLDMITGQDVARLLGVPNNDILEQILDALTSNNVEKLFDSMQVLPETGGNPSKIAQSIVSLLRTKLTTDMQSLPYNWTVRVMKDLLPLTAGNATFELLEVTLLGAINIHETTSSHVNNNDIQAQSETKAIQQKTNSQPTTEPAEIPIPSKANPTIEITPKNKNKLELGINAPLDTETTKEEAAIVSTDSDDSWSVVLSKMKTNYNTLYGVLRMATVKLNNNELTMNFKFDFHKKQLTQVKNMKIFQEIVNQTYGKKLEIIMLVNKSAAEKKIKSTSQPKDALMEDISNIFGGAELLD